MITFQVIHFHYKRRIAIKIFKIDFIVLRYALQTNILDFNYCINSILLETQKKTSPYRISDTLRTIGFIYVNQRLLAIALQESI